jgi:two-component system cell cycle sensor histidine kinase/response regulator CckA
LPEALRGPLSIIVRTAGDATELTRQLLAPAHASNQEKHAIDLARVVANCVEVALIRAGNAVQLQTQLEAELPPIAANRLQVQRLVMNILTNALEAVGNHGVVCVGAHVEALDAGALAHFQHASAAQPGAFAILSISDTGPGIDAERLSRIFEPFETSKSAGRGLGLGIVLEIVRNYGGALRVRSHLGQGTRFDIAFPLATSVPAPQSATPARAHTRQFSGSLLLIDDDRLVSVAMARALSTLGFEITLAEDGTRGLATFMESERAFDIVVLDWLMPGLCGEQLFAELRRARPTLPIVLVSGFGPDRLPIGDAFTARVQKPFSLDELRETFRRLLSPRPQRCEPPMPPMTAA